MCGICGFTNATDSKSDLDTLKAMCNIIAHRGPDGEGQYIENGIALGHRRLSLIDLEGGAQPMLKAAACASALSQDPEPDLEQDPEPDLKQDSELESEQDSEPFAIVFNGEIYNYQDIAAELSALGWTFQTTSDTEVLLTSYMQWGPDMLHKLRGMFAFAIWNPQTRKLFCARDPFGIKPFYYTEQAGQFIFASEIKAILEHHAYSRALNHEALEQYLCFQFSALPETFFKGVFKLLPAHYLVVGEGGIEQDVEYWQPRFSANEERSQKDTVSQIGETMQESVRYHNVADVEVGSFLSSGIDSSYMAACLTKENSEIKTFTVGFSEYGETKGERDEISWAQELAQLLGVKNSSKHITQEEYWEVLPKVQWHMDEPSADPSAVALYFVDQLAAREVKAVLSGEGADEFFAGYKIYQAPLAAHKLSWMPRGLLRAGARVLNKLGIRGSNYLLRASETVEDWYYTNANGVAFTPEERARILKGGCAAQTPQELVAPTYKRAAQQPQNDETTRMQYLDMYYWLVGDILLKTDKMSMAHSLESRVPFLDREVFNLAASIPKRLCVSAEQTKITLREAAEAAIPKDWARKEKLGFPVPIVKWLREDENYQKVYEWFTGAEAKEFFNTGELVALLERHKAGADLSRRIFIVWMFLIWYRIYFVDQKRPE